nr:hypothetical protein [Ktedonobacterales bacterium]
MPLDPLGQAGASDNPLPPSRPKTGFTSQPSEHQERELNLHDLVVKHPHAVFYFRATGVSTETVQILEG